MIVRDVRPEEMKSAGELRVAAYDAQGLLDASPGYAATLRVLGADGPGEVLVAAEEDRLLGTVMFEPRHEGSEVARDPGEGEIRALAVAPDARGRGVGRALVRAAIDLAARRGVGLLLLSTQPAMTTARRLYLSEGFRRLPERDWRPVPSLTLLAYGLDLPR
ncbi:GNAT family N-acetyltransferase [Streptosporangium sp. NPDC048047]|uniref:GNAT family N-acetyltransferase n=1 Tax=Streptosporangium sp. NPDC048047 TaxID=3155748 RepID=UPI00342883C2